MNDSKQILDRFDRNGFDAVLDYIIIGGFDETGKQRKVLKNDIRVRVEVEK